MRVKPETLNLTSPAAGFPSSSPVDREDLGRPRSHSPSPLAPGGTGAPSPVCLCATVLGLGWGVYPAAYFSNSATEA